MRRWNLLQLASPTSHPRKGGIAVVAMVVLLVSSLLITQYIRRAVNDRNHVKAEVERLQALSLADAGVALAEKAILKDPAWTGTQWDLPPGTLHQTKSGSVVISVSDGSCTVIARYPANSSSPVQITRKVSLTKAE